MPAPTEDSDALLARLRQEIDKRKRGAAASAGTGQGVPAPMAMTSSLFSSEETRRLDEARALVEHALEKNKVGPAWPRPVRGLRRNQSAVNESLAGALGGCLEILEGLRHKLLGLGALEQKIAELEERLEAQDHQLAELLRSRDRGES